MTNLAVLIPILIIVALLVSVLGSISGVGGGVLFVPILLFLLVDNTFDEIRFVSTLLVFITALINVIIEIIKKRFSWLLSLLIIAVSIPTLFFGNYLASLINQKITQIIVIIILSIITILLSFSDYLNKKIKIKPINKKAWYILKTNYGSLNIFMVMLIVFLAGIVTALTGMGGGPIIMPLLLLTCGLTMKNSTPISHNIIAIASLISLCLSYQFFSNQTLNLQVSLPMVCGVAIGTIVAAFIKKRIENETYIKWLLIILIWISIIKMIIDVAS